MAIIYAELGKIFYILLPEMPLLVHVSDMPFGGDDGILEGRGGSL